MKEFNIRKYINIVHYIDKKDRRYLLSKYMLENKSPDKIQPFLNWYRYNLFFFITALQMYYVYL